nr:hypothetical protein [uncultured Holophaga sp.]
MLLVITDFSLGEGVYTAEQLARLVPRLGYERAVLWDRGLQGYPRLREELEYQQAPVSLHLGSRFDWEGHAYGALPFSDMGYAGLCRLLTEQGHGRNGEPPRDCVLLAETLEGLEHLSRQGFQGTLLATPRNQREASEALRRGHQAVAPQVLRFRTPAGLELHRLKRAMATQSTLSRTEPLWDARDAAVDRRLWESRFPWIEPRIALSTRALEERIAPWRIHWGAWVSGGPSDLAGRNPDEALREAVLTGLPRRYAAIGGEIEARVERELDLIRRKGFADYFLLVREIVASLRPAGLVTRTCGRGSGAASIVSYALELTNVDPVGTNLMFERFLSEARLDPPDLDIDFAWDERDRVIQSVFERYGRERVAMVSNHVFYQPRSALRAVAMAHGRPEAELKTLAQLVRGWDGGLERAARNPAWTPVLEQASALKGHFCQFSVHPGGTVITPGPLWEHAPFQLAKKEGVSVTQWDKDGVENYGLVKIDLLGNRSLAVIRDACRVLGDRVPPRLDQHARQDPETRRTLAEGDSMGVFYVESPATRQLNQRVGRGDFETLVIHSSLIRPAAHHWIDAYVRRVRGEEVYVPSHPALGELLSESYGVLVYQEDVVRVAMALAGWGHEEADRLRKLLGKPDCERKLPAFEARFREGCATQGVSPEVTEEVWSMIRTFRGYSFCKPHSASYAQVSFESAWLKTHHPAAFFASVITNQGGFYPAIAYLGDARRHRLVVRGPDANLSEWAFSAEGEQGLRVGLMQVKGAREEEVRSLIAEREARGPFASLEELLERTKLSLSTLEALATGGAFDRWAQDGDRTRLLWTPLGGVPPGVRPRPTDPFERAELELETLELSLEIHPAALARLRHGGGSHRAAHAAVPGRRLHFWALVVADKTIRTERGEAMQFITFEDETALCEAVAFPDAFRKRRRPYRVGEVVPVAGRSTRQDGLVVLEVEG